MAVCLGRYEKYQDRTRRGRADSGFFRADLATDVPEQPIAADEPRDAGLGEQGREGDGQQVADDEVGEVAGEAPQPGADRGAVHGQGGAAQHEQAPRRARPSQRGEVTFAVRSSQPVWLEDLIQLVEQSASCELYSVLKRPDEKAVTERAYDNPVFVEDLVRNVAVRANREEAIVWYKVEAENFESIHNHNAYALVEHQK